MIDARCQYDNDVYPSMDFYTMIPVYARCQSDEYDDARCQYARWTVCLMTDAKKHNHNTSSL